MKTLNTEVDVTCDMCHETTTLLLDKADFIAWKGGKLIQDAMPYLSIDERELLISSICGKCFDKLFEDRENY